MSYLSRYLKQNTEEMAPYLDQDFLEEHKIDQEDEDDTDSFSRQITEAIYSKLGRKISNYNKEEMVESISYILQKNERQILQRLKFQQHDYIIPPRQPSNINIIYGIPSFPFNNQLFSTNNIYQPQISAPQTNPYLYTYMTSYTIPSIISNPSQMQVTNPMQFQSPFAYSQPPIFNSNQSIYDQSSPSKKKNKKKDKNKKDKKSKKEKKEKEADKKKSDKKSKKKDTKKPKKAIECSNGVFQYLFSKFGSNPINFDYLIVQGNSFNEIEERKLPSLIDPAKKCSGWASQDIADSYINIEFKKAFLKINKYTITVGNSDGTCFFKSWLINGTTSTGKTIVLDEVNDSSQIYERHTTITREVMCGEMIRSIQILKKSPSTWKSFPDRMIMRYFEIFGSLIEIE